MLSTLTLCSYIESSKSDALNHAGAVWLSLNIFLAEVSRVSISSDKVGHFVIRSNLPKSILLRLSLL